MGTLVSREFRMKILFCVLILFCGITRAEPFVSASAFNTEFADSCFTSVETVQNQKSVQSIFNVGHGTYYTSFGSMYFMYNNGTDIPVCVPCFIGLGSRSWIIDNNMVINFGPDIQVADIGNSTFITLFTAPNGFEVKGLAVVGPHVFWIEAGGNEFSFWGTTWPNFGTPVKLGSAFPSITKIVFDGDRIMAITRNQIFFIDPPTDLTGTVPAPLPSQTFTLSSIVDADAFKKNGVTGWAVLVSESVGMFVASKYGDGCIRANHAYSSIGWDAISVFGEQFSECVTATCVAGSSSTTAGTINTTSAAHVSHPQFFSILVAIFACLTAGTFLA